MSLYVAMSKEQLMGVVMSDPTLCNAQFSLLYSHVHDIITMDICFMCGFDEGKYLFKCMVNELEPEAHLMAGTKCARSLRSRKYFSHSVLSWLNDFTG